MHTQNKTEKYGRRDDITACSRRA